MRTRPVAQTSPERTGQGPQALLARTVAACAVIELALVVLLWAYTSDPNASAGSKDTALGVGIVAGFLLFLFLAFMGVRARQKLIKAGDEGADATGREARHQIQDSRDRGRGAGRLRPRSAPPRVHRGRNQPGRRGLLVGLEHRGRHADPRRPRTIPRSSVDRRSMTYPDDKRIGKTPSLP